MNKIVISIVAALLCLTSFSQNSQDILMTIDDRNITAEEFLRIYNKNKDITQTEDQKSMDEYLDLFINYKLKVIEAENIGYDTSRDFIDEYNGYIKQLAKPYLQNQDLKEFLIEESYERLKTEVNASHILIDCAEDALPEDTLSAFNKITEIRARILGGEPFEEVAKATSDDPSVKENGGALGYFSALNMVYNFENHAYNTPVGKVSGIFRTPYGYHILKVNDKRPNRGSVLAAHIMTRIPSNASEPEKLAAKDKINQAYIELMEGKSWKEVVQLYSENPRTKANDGVIGWMQTGQAPDVFLNPCFDMEAGEFGKPVETPGGFHIPRVIEKRPVESLEEIRDVLSNRIDRDQERVSAIEKIKSEELKEKYGFQEYPENFRDLFSQSDSGLVYLNLQGNDLQKPVFILGNKEYKQQDFIHYLTIYQKLTSSSLSAKRLLTEWNDYISNCLNEYAIEELPNENSDYKYLLQEYHDGILLFNLTNDIVWSKAQTDTIGLQRYYRTAQKYYWQERIEVNIYTYSNSSFTAVLPKLIKTQIKKDYGIDYLNKQLCPADTTDCIHLEKKVYEKGQDAIADQLEWQNGTSKVINAEDVIYYYYVTDIRPSEAKSLNEARGLYIADYQNFLEAEWIENLREKYKIDLNNEVLAKIKTNN